MKRIMIMSYGDPLSSKTWSNMPYYLAKTIEKKGYTIIPVDLFPHNSLLSKLFGIRRRVLSKILGKDLYISYDRTSIFNFFIKRKMKKHVRNNQFDLCISLSFSFNPKDYTSKPCIMLCDWTTEYSIKNISCRDISRLEYKTIKIQEQYLKKSDLNITVFKEIQEFYKDSSFNFKYFGNAINLPYIEFTTHDIENKYNSNSITFIGKEKYSSALGCLLDALMLLDLDINLNVIGISNYNSDYQKVKYYGYLDKADAQDLHKYINIITNSKCVINTNDVFASFSALVEAMYLYTPLITSKSLTFTKIFGEEESFGFFSCNDSEELSQKILQLLNIDFILYSKMAHNCRKLVNESTWDAYVGRILSYVEEYLYEE